MKISQLHEIEDKRGALYHGTNVENLTQFDRQFGRTANHIYTRHDPETAAGYGKHVYKIQADGRPQIDLTDIRRDYIPALNKLYADMMIEQEYELRFPAFIEVLERGQIYQDYNRHFQDDIFATLFGMGYNSVVFYDVAPGNQSTPIRTVFDDPSRLNIIGRGTVDPKTGQWVPDNTIRESARMIPVPVGKDIVKIYENPNHAEFWSLLEQFGKLRGLLSHDLTRLYVWDAALAIHSRIHGRHGVENDFMHYLLMDRGSIENEEGIPKETLEQRPAIRRAYGRYDFEVYEYREENDMTQFEESLKEARLIQIPTLHGTAKVFQNPSAEEFKILRSRHAELRGILCEKKFDTLYVWSADDTVHHSVWVSIGEPFHRVYIMIEDRLVWADLESWERDDIAARPALRRAYGQDRFQVVQRD